MELSKVFEVINEAFEMKDITIWCQKQEIDGLKKKIEELENKNETVRTEND